MSHHGNTNRETEASPQELEHQHRSEQDINYIPRNLFPMHRSIRSEISMPADPQGGAFDISGFARLGGNDDAAINLAYAQKPEATFDFENRKFSAIENRPPLPGSTMFNEGERFDMLESLTEDLGRFPLIDVNEPTPVQGFTNNSDSIAFTQNMSSGNTSDENIEGGMVPNRYERQHIYSMFALGSCAPQRGNDDDDDTDQKAAAIDPTLLQNPQDQHYDPSQQFMYSNQAASLDQSLQDRAEEEKELDEGNPSPVTSVAPRNRSSNLKPHPRAFLTGQRQRRSRRLTSRATRKKDSPPSTGAKAKRPKAVAKPKTKSTAKHKLASKMSFKPTPTQLVEANTQRKLDALQTWFKRFEELVEFVDKNGHANVPQQFVENHSLGIWVNKQRMEKKAKDEGKSTSLTDEKVEMLEKVGFIWAKRKGQSAWEEKFQELQDYKLKHGNCNVPTKNKQNRALGRWVSTQRANYKRLQQGNPPKQRRTDWEEAKRRIRRLNGIGFAWSLLPACSPNEERDEDDQESRIMDENDSNPRSSPVKKRKRREENDGKNEDKKQKQGEDSDEKEEEQEE